MSDAAPPRIVLLAPRQAKAAGAILARSHAGYPSFRHLYPDSERRARVLAAVFSGVAHNAARLGSAYGAIGGDAELRGVAIWLAPGNFPWSPSRQLPRHWLDAVGAAGRSTFVSSVHADRGERRAPSSRRPALVPGDDGCRPRGPASRPRGPAFRAGAGDGRSRRGRLLPRNRRSAQCRLLRPPRLRRREPGLTAGPERSGSPGHAAPASSPGRYPWIFVKVLFIHGFQSPLSSRSHQAMGGSASRCSYPPRHHIPTK